MLCRLSIRRALPAVWALAACCGLWAVPAAAQIFPSGITGLQVRYDADAITGLSNGDPVSAWADTSGNGRDMTVFNALNSPTYIASGMNGLPVLRFTNDPLGATFAGNTFSTSAGLTMFAVFQTTTNSSTQTLISLDQSGGGVNQAFMYANRWQTGDLFASFDAGSGDNDETQNLEAGYNDGLAHVFTAIGTSPSTVTLRADGGAEVLSHSDGVGSVTIDGLSVGSLNAAASAFYTGDIAELLVYNRVLTGGEITQVEGYLIEKWGAVPEPSTWMLGLAAIAAGGWWARRRKAQAA